MSQPRQVQEAQERTERLIEQLAKPEGGNEDLPNPPPEGALPPVPAGDEGLPPDQRPDRTDWKARYLVLKGKYDAEVPRLHTEIRTLKLRLEAVEEANTTLRAEAAAKPPVPDAGLEKLREEYGDDIVQTIERIADRRANELIQPLQGKVNESEAERRARAQKDEADAKAAAFTDAVNDLVPDWESIDQLPVFHAYLAESGTDGRSRQELLMEAANRYDAAGAARIFVAFKRSPAFKAASTPPPPPKTERLERQVVPEPSGREAAPPAGKVWTKAEVKAFFSDKARGKFDSDPERAKTIERDIDAAMREGRIR